MEYENIHMTRLSDLPDMVPPQQQQQQMPGGFGENSNMYVPLNIHPSPFGISPPVGGMIPPQPDMQQQPQSQQQMQQPQMSQQQQQQQMSQLQQQQMQQQMHMQQQQMQMSQQQMPQYPSAPRPDAMMPNHNEPLTPDYRLPQRDIPSDLSDFTHDEEIKPNYIPKRKLARDFVREHEESTREQMLERQRDLKNEANNENWFNILHVPLLITVLYFAFNLPIVNTIVFKRFSFLNIYREDGNYNMMGLILKAVLFGFTYWCIHTGMYKLISI